MFHFIRVFKKHSLLIHQLYYFREADQQLQEQIAVDEAIMYEREDRIRQIEVSSYAYWERKEELMMMEVMVEVVMMKIDVDDKIDYSDCRC